MKVRPRALVVSLLIVLVAALTPVTARPLSAAASGLTLIRQDLAVSPDGTLTIVVQSPEPYTDQVALKVTSYQRIVTREELQNTIDDGPRRFADQLAIDPTAVSVGADGSMTLSIPTTSAASTSGPLQFLDEGLYPIVIEMRAGQRVIGQLLTFVYRLGLPTDASRGSMNVAVVASVTAPPAIPGVDSPLSPEVTTSVAELAAYGDFADSVKPTIAISPEILTSNRVDSDTLARLRSVLSQSVLLSQPRVPFDPSSAVASSQTERFTQFLRDGENATTSVAEVPTADREVWATTDPITTDGASMLRDLGFHIILMSPDDYYAAEGSKQGFTDFSELFRINLPDGDKMPMGVIDPALSDRLLDTRWSPEQAALFAAADIVVWRDQLAESLSPVSGRTVVLGLSDGGVPKATLVKRIAEMATGTGAATFTNGLSDYLRTTEYQNINGLPIDVTLQATPAVDLTTRERRLNELTLTSTSIASMLVNDNGRAAQWTDTVNTLWSTALTDNDVETGASVLDAELKAITDGVVPPQPYSFSLSGRRATIPVRITNTLSEPLQVVVRLSAAADKLTFPEGDQVALLAPDDVTEVQVPVVARTNGFFEVKVDVLTPRGNHQVASTSIRANVSALTGLAQVLTGAALLILLTWWVRNFRRSRRVRRGLQTLPSHPSAQPIKVAEEGPTDLEPAHAGDSSSGNGARNATPEVQPAATNGELPERDGTASATLSDS